MPEWYAEEPILNAGEARYLAAFWVLSTCRPRGPDFLAPIPWWAMVAYADHYGLSRVATENLVTVIRGLDSEYLKLEGERLKRERGA